MKIEFVKSKRECTIQLGGSVDRVSETPSDFYEALENAADCDKILLDLSDARFLSTVYISQLVKFRNVYNVEFKKVTIVTSNSDIYDILKITGITKIYLVQLKKSRKVK
jgi:anti-anti-sigma regulatory factor